MINLIIDNLPRIIKARKKLEKELAVKIIVQEKEICISGSSEKEYIAVKVIEAIDLGFPMSHALSIKKQDVEFSIINIKSHALSKNIKRIKARIIGRGGKVLSSLSSLSDCFFEIKDNKLGIIGYSEDLKRIQEAVIMLIKGAKHGNVYGFLERNQPEPIIDLGLKEEKKKKN